GSLHDLNPAFRRGVALPSVGEHDRGLRIPVAPRRPGYVEVVRAEVQAGAGAGLYQPYRQGPRRRRIPPPPQPGGRPAHFVGLRRMVKPAADALALIGQRSPKRRPGPRTAWLALDAAPAARIEGGELGCLAGERKGMRTAKQPQRQYAREPVMQM